MTWLGTKKLAVILAQFPDLPRPANWNATIEQRVFTGPNSLKDYINTVSYGRAVLDGEVFGPYIIERRDDYRPQPGARIDYAKAMDDAIGKACPSTAAGGYVYACVIFNDDNLGAWAFWGQSNRLCNTIIGFNLYPMNTSLGALAMENIHSMAQFGDLYGTWVSPGRWDEMDAASGMHPSAFTKIKLRWLNPQEIAVIQYSIIDDLHPPHLESQNLLALGLSPQSNTVSSIMIPMIVPLGYEYYLVELRQRVDDYERGKPDISVGIPDEGVVVYYIDEARWPPVHRRALLKPGEHYRNFTHKLDIAFNSLNGNIAEIRISVYPPIPSQRRTIPGIVGFFASESIALARLGGYQNSTRNVLDPAVHYGWAFSQLLPTVLDDLLDKYKLQYDRQGRLGGDPAARFYADTTVRLVTYGVNFGSAMTYSSADPANSPDWPVHYQWAQDSGIQSLINETENRLRTLFHFFMEDPKHFLVALFAWESVYLAKLGGYNNPTRNDTNPAVHFDWAMSLPSNTVRDDLIEKYNLQFDRLYADPLAFLLVPAFYAQVSVRLDSLGVDFGSPAANSLDYDLHANWAVNATQQAVKDETARRIRILLTELAKP